MGDTWITFITESIIKFFKLEALILGIVKGGDYMAVMSIINESPEAKFPHPGLYNTVVFFVSKSKLSFKDG